MWDLLEKMGSEQFSYQLPLFKYITLNIDLNGEIVKFSYINH